MKYHEPVDKILLSAITGNQSDWSEEEKERVRLNAIIRVLEIMPEEMKCAVPYNLPSYPSTLWGWHINLPGLFVEQVPVNRWVSSTMISTNMMSALLSPNTVHIQMK